MMQNQTENEESAQKSKIQSKINALNCLFVGLIGFGAAFISHFQMHRFFCFFIACKLNKCTCLNPENIPLQRGFRVFFSSFLIIFRKCYFKFRLIFIFADLILNLFRFTGN